MRFPYTRIQKHTLSHTLTHRSDAQFTRGSLVLFLFLFERAQYETVTKIQSTTACSKRDTIAFTMTRFHWTPIRTVLTPPANRATTMKIETLPVAKSS